MKELKMNLKRIMVSKRVKNLLYFFLISVVWSLGGLFAIYFRYDNALPNNSFEKIGLATFILIPLYFSVSYIDSRILGAQKSGTFEYYFSIIRKFLLSGTVFFILLGFYPNFVLPKSYPLLTSILAVALFFTLLKLYRFIALKWIYHSNDIPIAIYGAGYQGQILLEKISKDFTLNWKPILILDDDSSINVSRINGVRVITDFDFYEIFKKFKVRILIISFHQITSKKLQEIQKICEKFGVELRIISPMAALLGKDIKEEDVRVPTNEELLGKTSIKINYDIAKKFIQNKKILITGAGGSIGSELSKQINYFEPKHLFLLDRDETALFRTKLLLERELPDAEVGLILADLRDYSTITKIINEHRPEIIFHTAALKHLDLLQRFPDEALKTNVQATDHLVSEARNFQVNVFVNVSTDKAADPISVLGVSKLAAERLVSGVSTNLLDSSSRFLSVRFGNVFGSRGSVIEKFMHQIKHDLPVTISDKYASRYFMTIQEAVHLLIRAAAFGNNGETLVLDMGDQIMIETIAKKLIVNSGKNISIKYTGLKQGEKISESLVGSSEIPIKTDDSLILSLRVNPWELPKNLQNWHDFLKVFK